MGETPSIDSKTHRLVALPGEPMLGEVVSIRLADEYEKRAARLAFLFPVIGNEKFRLYPPDIHDLRWSVWDLKKARTISRGETREEAIDNAIETDLRERSTAFLSEAELETFILTVQ